MFTFNTFETSLHVLNTWMTVFGAKRDSVFTCHFTKYRRGLFMILFVRGERGKCTTLVTNVGMLVI